MCTETNGTREARLRGPGQGAAPRISRRRKRGVRSGRPRGSEYRGWPCRTTRPEGRTPAVVPVVEARTREDMTGRPGSNQPGGHSPIDNVRQLQRRLWVAAKRAPERRFHALLDRIWRRDVLQEAWRRVRANRGSAGRRCMTLAEIEQYGVDRVLDEHPRRAARRHVSPAAGSAALHPQGRWPAAAARYPDGSRPCRADGGDAGADADLRGRLPALVVWLPAPAQRDAGTGNVARPRGARWTTTCSMRTSATTSAVSIRRSSGAAGSGASRIGGCCKLLRQWLTAGVLEDDRWSRHDHRDAARRGDLAPALQHLPARTRPPCGRTSTPISGTLVRYADDFVVLCRTQAAVEHAEQRCA